MSSDDYNLTEVKFGESFITKPRCVHGYYSDKCVECRKEDSEILERLSKTLKKV